MPAQPGQVSGSKGTKNTSKMRCESERVTGKAGVSAGLGRGAASAGARDSLRRAIAPRPNSAEPILPALRRGAPPSSETTYRRAGRG